MDPSAQFIVPTVIDVPELIVTNDDDADYDDSPPGPSSVWLQRLQTLAGSPSQLAGLASVWRFPALAYKHGGGAYLAVYTVLLVLIGLPLVLMELAFGQYANEGPITIWRISPAFEGIGYSMCLVSATVALYYNIINAWSLRYLLSSLTLGPLPWASCDNPWNTNKCFLRPDQPTMSRPAAGCSPPGLTCNSSLLAAANSSSSSPLASSPTGPNETLFEFERIINSTDEVLLPANEFFHRRLLHLSGSLSELGGPNWSQAAALCCAWALTFTVCHKHLRVASNSRLALLVLAMPYLALAGLLLRASTLDGFGAGVSYYLEADWGRLQAIDIWSDACTQIFYTLSPAWGCLITLASMNKFHNNFHADALLMCAINYVTSLLAGLVAFATLGYMSNYSGIAIPELVEPSLGFVYMVYSEMLAQMPLPNLNSACFFAVLLMFGLLSQLSVLDTVISTIVDTWPHKLRYRKPLILMSLCASLLALSLATCLGNGFYLVQLIDMFAGSYAAMFIALLELVAISWVYGIDNFMQDIDDMISAHKSLLPSRAYWHFLWRYLTPSVLFAVLILVLADLRQPSYRGLQQPEWPARLGWSLSALAVSIVPAIALLRLLLSPGASLADKVAYLCKPSEDWAPSSYVSGPKLIDRHMLGEADYGDSSGYAPPSDRARQHRHELARPGSGAHHKLASDQRLSLDDDDDDDDRDSIESNEDLKLVDGRANYIIPEEEDDTDTGLVTSETNV